MNVVGCSANFITANASGLYAVRELAEKFDTKNESKV